MKDFVMNIENLEFCVKEWIKTRVLTIQVKTGIQFISDVKLVDINLILN